MPVIDEQQRIRISAGRVIDPASEVDSIQDVFVAAGRIVALGQAPDGFTADREIDAAADDNESSAQRENAVYRRGQ